MRELIPSPVFDSIRTHLKTVAEGAVTGWEANQDEEDSLTGDLGRLLTTPHTVHINLDGQIWRWCVRYKKFRSRGEGAFDASSGADGIIKASRDVWCLGIQFSKNKFGACRALFPGMGACFPRRATSSSKELRTGISKRIAQIREKKSGRWQFLRL